MISLTELQADALTELVNIGFGFTASKLSEITGHRVLLDVPNIQVHPMDALARELGLFVTGEVATVHQIFSGPVSGDAILFLNYEGAIKLSNLLVDEDLRLPRFDSYTKEILTEVGNMLLGACLGMFGNLLEVHVTFSVPRLHLDSLEHFLSSIVVRGNELRYAIVVASHFRILAQGVEGRIVIALGLSSLERLIEALERWEGSQSFPALDLS